MQPHTTRLQSRLTGTERSEILAQYNAMFAVLSIYRKSPNNLWPLHRKLLKCGTPVVFFYFRFRLNLYR